MRCYVNFGVLTFVAIHVNFHCFHRFERSSADFTLEFQITWVDVVLLQMQEKVGPAKL